MDGLLSWRGAFDGKGSSLLDSAKPTPMPQMRMDWQQQQPQGLLGAPWKWSTPESAPGAMQPRPHWQQQGALAGMQSPDWNAAPYRMDVPQGMTMPSAEQMAFDRANTPEPMAAPTGFGMMGGLPIQAPEAANPQPIDYGRDPSMPSGHFQPGSVDWAQAYNGAAPAYNDQNYFTGGLQGWRF